MNAKRILAFIAGAAALGFATLAPAADLGAIYTKQCGSCHAKDGSGSTKAGKLAGAKDLRDAKVQEGFTDEKAAKSIKEGLKGPDGKFRMKPAQNVSDEEIKGLVQLVRKFKK